MRRRLAGILALALAAVASVSPASAAIDQPFHKESPDAWTWGEILEWATGGKGFARSFALVIGISGYEHFEDLETTSGNPLRVKDHLIDEAGFDYVHVLTDEKVTWSRIQALIMVTFRNMMSPDDRFLFYWSGHGTQVLDHEGEPQGFLPLSGSEPDDLASMVEMETIVRLDRYLNVKQSLYILDACFSGLAFPETKASQTDHTIERLAKPSRHLLTAATGDQQTIASRTWSGSLFTDSFLKGISGAADAETDFRRDGVVSLLELTEYVRARVDAERRRKGWRGEITPKLHDLRDNEGEFFFVSPDKKIAKRQSEGGEYQGRFEDGMPVIVMGPDARPPAASGDPYGGRDVTVFGVIKDSAIAKDFEDFLDQFPESAFAPYARNRVALLEQRETHTPPPSVTARLDPATTEAALNLRPEDTLVVQEALTALGFDTRGADGVFGANTRRAIAGWQRERGEHPTGYLTASQYGKLLAEAETHHPAVRDDSSEPITDGGSKTGSSELSGTAEPPLKGNCTATTIQEWLRCDN